MVLTPKDIEKMQDRLFGFCRSQAKKKGNDYSGNSEDTFMNLRRVKDFKCTQNDMQTVLAELVKKCSRMSNFSMPGFVSEVTEESAFDTVSDLINYATYWQMFFEEEKAKNKHLKPTEPWGPEDDAIFARYSNGIKIKKKKKKPRKASTDEERIKQLFKPKRKVKHVRFGNKHTLTHLNGRKGAKK